MDTSIDKDGKQITHIWVDEMPPLVTNRQPKKTPRRFRKRLNDDELAKVLKDLHR